VTRHYIIIIIIYTTYMISCIMCTAVSLVSSRQAYPHQLSTKKNKKKPLCLSVGDVARRCSAGEDSPVTSGAFKPSSPWVAAATEDRDRVRRVHIIIIMIYIYYLYCERRYIETLNVRILLLLCLHNILLLLLYIA